MDGRAIGQSNQRRQAEVSGFRKVADAIIQFFRSFFIKGGYVDYTLLFLVLFLFGFGLIMVYSASSYQSAMFDGRPYAYFIKQAVFGLVGIVVMIVMRFVNYHRLKTIAVLGFFVIIAFLVIVLVAGHTAGGATRWLTLGPITFQPSEFAKVVLIMWTARAININVWEMGSLKNLLIMMILPSFMIFLILIENLSTGIVCAIICITMLFVASPKYWHFFVMLLAAVLLGGLFVLFKGYRMERFDAWLNVETHPKGYQTLQSMYAIGSGGLFGKGLGQSIQKMSYIPAGHNDMIFSIICEELGIVGAFILILLFILLIWRLMVIACNAKDLFGSMLVVGVIAHIACQVLINISVVTNLIPNTGVPLPFISYGGTSVIGLFIEMGIVMSVASQIQQRKE